MVSNLTLGKKKYAASEAEMRAIKREGRGAAPRPSGAGAAPTARLLEAVFLRRVGLSQATAAEGRRAGDFYGDPPGRGPVSRQARVPLQTAEACVRVIGIAGRRLRLATATP